MKAWGWWFALVSLKIRIGYLYVLFHYRLRFNSNRYPDTQRQMNVLKHLNREHNYAIKQDLTDLLKR